MDHMLVWVLLVVTNMRQALPSRISNPISETGLTHIMQPENEIKRVLLAHQMLCANWKTEMLPTPRGFTPAPTACEQRAWTEFLSHFILLARCPMCSEQLTQPYMKIRPNKLNLIKFHYDYQ